MEIRLMVYAPYVSLALAVLAVFLGLRKTSLTFAAIGIGLGLYVGILRPAALLPIGVLLCLLAFPPKRPAYSYLRFGLVLLLALGLSNHLLPGFYNLKVFDGVRFSSDSLPFTMYLNFDKTTAGILICLFWVKGPQSGGLRRSDLLVICSTLSLLTVVLMPLAMTLGYVQFDLKLPPWLWVLNNLLFVCLAEEALFRGVIQRKLSSLMPKTEWWRFAPVAVTAALFGLAHYRGGANYVLLSTAAGMFYGYAFMKTDKIESSILVHFGLNLLHICFFSYPALAQS